MHGRAESHHLGPTNGMSQSAHIVRRATQADVEGILDLLEGQEFTQPLTRDDLRRLFTVQWTPQAPLRGFVLVDEHDRLAGCLGIIFSPVRTVEGRHVATANLHTMFVDRARRHRYTRMPPVRYSAALIAAAVDLGLTLTALTARGPNDVVPRLLEDLSFEPVSSGDVFYSAPAAVGGWVRQRGEILSGADTVAPLLDHEHHRIVEDHRALGCGFHLIRGRGGACFIVTRRRRFPAEWLWPSMRWERWRRRRFPVSDILYLSDIEIAQRSWDRLVLHVSALERTVGVTCSTAIRPSNRRPNIPFKTYVHGRRTSPRAVDKLYSELVLYP